MQSVAKYWRIQFVMHAIHDSCIIQHIYALCTALRLQYCTVEYTLGENKLVFDLKSFLLEEIIKL